MKERILIIVHMIIAILAATSFIWLDYKILLIGILLFWLQILVFGSCVLTIAQFKNKDTVFIGVYLNKILRYFNFKELTIKQQKIFVRYIEPAIILLLALILQVIFKIKPLI